MYNPFKFIKDVIDILKDGGPGEAIGAMEITDENREQIATDLGPDAAKYAKTGDYVVEFDTGYVSIAPQREFQKHYAFIGYPMPNVMNVVRTIKPL